MREFIRWQWLNTLQLRTWQYAGDSLHLLQCLHEVNAVRRCVRQLGHRCGRQINVDDGMFTPLNSVWHCVACILTS